MSNRIMISAQKRQGTASQRKRKVIIERAGLSGQSGREWRGRVREERGREEQREGEEREWSDFAPWGGCA